MNVVNVGERYKEVTFTTYPPENKGPVNVVNVVRRFFASSRTSHAKQDREPDKCGSVQTIPSMPLMVSWLSAGNWQLRAVADLFPVNLSR